MSPIFQSLSSSPKFAIAVLTGDNLLRDDAVSFLRDDLPLWEGIWDQKKTPKPAANESSFEQVAKMARCVALFETRTIRDHVRLRFHKLLQYQAFARCLAAAEVEDTHQTSTINHIMQKIHGHRWISAGTDQRKRLKNTFHAQKRAGKRLQILCNHVGYGFLLLGSRAAVGRILEPTFTDEMFHALVCYVCNMFPQLRRGWIHSY
ncbi:hypothetical protein B0T11DRAFT_324948 [Plectosphaerella cucumerina]|uniref:Uncharacterized protein n=1 Tax=Plectosphaerella cucumerina TaxID=40658 RepID=A0A8K0TRD5_9PEZI|nr:hypothetical protein B0T11DRAFT_324948 [Plectosphaerella cucumerina]